MRCEVDECEMELSASDPWVGLCFKHRMDAEQTESGCRVEGCWQPATAPFGFCEEHRTDTRQANDRQEGGDHYKQLSPEPWDVIDCWGLDYFTGNALKYIARASLSGMSEPLVQDLRKAVHYLEKAIERERPAPEPGPDWDHASALHGGVSLEEEPTGRIEEAWTEDARCVECDELAASTHLLTCSRRTCDECGGIFGTGHAPHCSRWKRPGRIVNAKAVVRPRKPE